MAASVVMQEPQVVSENGGAPTPGTSGVVLPLEGRGDAGGGTANKFQDSGGTVVQIARVQLVYWGSAWSAGPALTSDAITQAVQTMLASAYMTGLSEYRQVGRGHLLGATVITSSDPPNPFADSDVANFISARIADGTLPGLDAFNQNIYFVIMPTGVAPTNQGIIGEHTYYLDGSGTAVHFSWVTNDGTLDSVTTTFSHELVETCTDPEGSAILGVAGTCSGGGWCEIGDVCGSTDVRDGVTVQSFWSDAAGACIVPDWPQIQLPQSGVQFTDVLPANSTKSWFTFNWPEYEFVVWQVVPTTPIPGAPEVAWKVGIERASGAYVTYWITATNKTGSDITVEAHYTILSI